MYSVTANELDSLQDSGLSATVDLALFTLCFGILATLLVTVSTVDISDAKMHAAFVACLLVSGLASVYFGARAGLAWKSARGKLKELKGERA